MTCKAGGPPETRILAGWDTHENPPQAPWPALGPAIQVHVVTGVPGCDDFVIGEHGPRQVHRRRLVCHADGPVDGSRRQVHRDFELHFVGALDAVVKACSTGEDPSGGSESTAGRQSSLSIRNAFRAISASPAPSRVSGSRDRAGIMPFPCRTQKQRSFRSGGHRSRRRARRTSPGPAARSGSNRPERSPGCKSSCDSARTVRAKGPRPPRSGRSRRRH